MKTLRIVDVFLGCIAGLGLVGTAHALPTTNQLVSLTGSWRYTTNNVDAADWTAPGYNDSSWKGPSNALFYIESATLPAAKNTRLPSESGGDPVPCYFFRTSFSLANLNDLVALHVTHLTDDGAIFYLNGAEIQRVRMLAGSVGYATEALDTPPDGDATAFESFTVVGGWLTNLVEGLNVLAVRVHQHGTDSSDVVFGAKVSTVTDPAPVIRLVRGPYMQVCTPSSVVFRWRTNFGENSRVTCGTGVPGTAVKVVSDGALVTEHEVTVTNLLPDTRYDYSIGSDSRVLAGDDGTCSFRTHPLPGQPKPLRLWVTGDAGTANEDAQAVRDAFDSANGTNAVHAWLQLGDNAYMQGTDEQYQAAMFDMFSERLRSTPVWTTTANHETYSTDWNGQYPYLNIFTMPTLGEAGGVASGTKLYFSFDIGMVHVISLDSMLSDRSPDGEMANWLRADLAATTNLWVIAFFHHPPYSKGSHDSDTSDEMVEMRHNLIPILEAGGVDLVLSGHSHSYERSFLLNGHYGESGSLIDSMILDRGSGMEADNTGAYAKPKSADGTPVGNRGTVYAVAGCSGKTSGGTLDHPAMFFSKNSLGSMVLDITPDRLNAIYLRETGATNDGFTIIKDDVAPVASNGAYSVSSDVPAAIFLTAGDVDGDPVTFALGSLPTNGLVSGFNAASGLLTYMPARGGTGGDRIGFVANDGKFNSLEAFVTVQVLPPVDTDGDGMPDHWETLYGVTDTSGDPDNDGATNLQEYRAGTDPKNPQSRLKVTRGIPVGAAFQVTWSSVGGTRYRVLYADGNRFNGVFTPLPQAVTQEMDPHPYGTPGTMSFTDDFSLIGAPPPLGCRLFRISVVP